MTKGSKIMAFKGFKDLPERGPRPVDSHTIGKMAVLRVYQGKYVYPAREHMEIRDEVDRVFEARVAVNHDGTIFGLVDDWYLPYDLPDHVIRLSMMSYYLDKYFQPAEVIARLREAGANGRFLFDAGQSRAPLWAEADDMERAFQELGLL
jgi:hypothetical protein